MKLDLLVIIGLLGQACFFGRFFIQWLKTERARRITVPVSFWWLSLGGAVLAVIHAFGRGSLVFLAAPAVNFFIYARNLAILRGGRRLCGSEGWWLLAGLFALVGLGALMRERDAAPPLWLTIGIIGQAVWISRFPLQWLHAERSGMVTLSTSFFAISFVGSSLLLSYALYLGEPVFILSQVINPVLFGRQLWISLRTSERLATAGDGLRTTERSGALPEGALPEFPARAAR